MISVHKSRETAERVLEIRMARLGKKVEECNTRIVWVKRKVPPEDVVIDKDFSTWKPGEKFPMGRRIRTRIDIAYRERGLVKGEDGQLIGIITRSDAMGHFSGLCPHDGHLDPARIRNSILDEEWVEPAVNVKSITKMETRKWRC